VASAAPNYEHTEEAHKPKNSPATTTPVAVPSVVGAVLSIFQTFKLHTTSSLISSFVAVDGEATQSALLELYSQLAAAPQQY